MLGKTQPQEDHARLRGLIHPLRWRTTSRIEDETLCLGGCIDHIPQEPTHDFQETDSAQRAIDRMRLFLSTLHTVPVGLLFVPRPRIEQDGCRWMPVSFLGGGMDGTMPDPWQEEDISPIGRPTPHGLEVILPGILLLKVAKYTQEFRGGQIHDIIFIKVEGVDFFAYSLMSKPVSWDGCEDRNLALILRGEVDKRGVMACLVTMEQQHTDTILCRFEGCVNVLGNPEIHRNLDHVVFSETRLTDKAQKWCVQ